MSPCTIVLPLRGRPLFTLRFLWHANLMRVPCRILIADGQVSEPLASLLENSRATFPHLDIEYIRYPDDASYGVFFAKMADVLQRVKTPYAMVVDNDDFLVFSGIEKSTAFLDSAPDYVCCGGGLGGLSVYSVLDSANGGLTGAPNRYAYRYTPFDRSEDYGSNLAVERLRQGSRNWWSYYAVYRKEVLATITGDVVKIGFSDLQLHELFCAMRTLTLGKARSDPSTFSYIRQYGTSMRTSLKKDWVNHLLRSNFSCDFNTMIGEIAASASKSDCVEIGQVDEMLRGICEEWLRAFLRVNYGEVQGLKQLMRDHTPGLVKWLLGRRRYFVGRERAAMLSKLRRDGASASYIDRFNGELASIESVLTGDAFAGFIKPHIARLAGRQ
jgi:glycosyltransferase domain-containing protein